MTIDVRRPSLVSVVTVAAWITIVGAIVELAVLGVSKRSSPMFRLGADYPWIAPLALAATAFAAALPWAAIHAVRNSRLGLFGVAASVFFVVGLNTLMLVAGLSHYTAAILAFGAALQAGRMVSGSPGVVWMRRSLPVVGAILVAVVAGQLTFAAAARPNRAVARTADPVAGPNVLLITLDTVRAFSMSLYGYERATTPRLEQFARSGAVFSRAFATAPWTLPSHASLFTGRWAHELSTGYETPLDGTYPTLAEYLAERGYRTGGFAANLGYVSRDTGLARGFEHYEDYQRSIGEVLLSSTLLRRVSGNFRLRNMLENDQHINRIHADDLSDRALLWMTSDSTRPFFAFINFFDAHEPYLPPAPYDTRFGPGRARGRRSPLHRWLWDVTVDHRPMSAAEVREEQDAYDGALAALDHQVGELLAELERRGVLRNTVVVITADHGEEFGEHGVFEHGYSLYRPALQVPLIVLAPGRAPATRVDAPVTLRDVPATVVDLIGTGSGAPFPGSTLARHWSAAPSVSEPLLSEVAHARGQPDWFPVSQGDMISAIAGGLRCIRRGDGLEELYDVDTDPWERRDLAGDPAYAARLKDCQQARERARSAAR